MGCKKNLKSILKTLMSLNQSLKTICVVRVFQLDWSSVLGSRRQRQEINGREEATASLAHTYTPTYTRKRTKNLQIVYRINYQFELVQFSVISVSKLFFFFYY